MAITGEPILEEDIDLWLNILRNNNNLESYVLSNTCLSV